MNRSLDVLKAFSQAVIGLLFVSLLFACKTNQEMPKNIMVSGLVTDSEGGPVSGVSISISELGVELQSDSDGSFSITNISPGNFTFTVKKEGYYFTQKVRRIESNVELNFRVLSSIKDPFGSLVTSASAGTPRFSGPALFRLSADMVLLAYEEFYEGEGDDFDQARIMGRLSTDGGYNWAAPFVMLERNDPVLQASFLRVDDKILAFFLERFKTDDLRVVKGELFSDGKSLVNLGSVTVPNSGYYQINNDRAISMENGNILLPLAYNRDIATFGSDDPIQALSLISKDQGISWFESNNRVVVPPLGADEPGVIELGGGKILMYIRTNNEYVFSSISNDYGLNWSEPEKILSMPSPSAPATMKKIPNKNDILAIWNDSTNANSWAKRDKLSSAISMDDGSLFSFKKTLEGNSSYSAAYPSVIFDGSNAIITYWIRDDRTIDESGTGLIDVKVRVIPIQWFYD